MPTFASAGQMTKDRMAIEWPAAKLTAAPRATVTLPNPRNRPGHQKNVVHMTARSGTAPPAWTETNRFQRALSRSHARTTARVARPTGSSRHNQPSLQQTSRRARRVARPTSRRVDETNESTRPTSRRDQRVDETNQSRQPASQPANQPTTPDPSTTRPPSASRTSPIVDASL